jgi:hypothetical protein
VTLEDGAGIVSNQLDDSLSVPRLLGLHIRAGQLDAI